MSSYSVLSKVMSLNSAVGYAEINLKFWQQPCIAVSTVNWLHQVNSFYHFCMVDTIKKQNLKCFWGSAEEMKE